uniref:LRRCT domain-containing protein n=1 Tax=Lepisosteus oculatus TaxID=7918 RepID=W5M6K3_LEPOC
TEVPLTTKAVLFTDGNIDSLRNRSFSYPSNMTLLGLSNNAIAHIEENAFRNLTALRALLLDHNRISTSAILESTFSQLPHLEILQLGNNALQVVKGSWFKDLGSLLTLQLEGNLISRLDSNTFEFSMLSSLETLDLSDNLITYIARDSFANLPRLRSIDLSRNSLTLIPDAFSYLSWLSALNLDINRWNCSCELRELSEFLSSYIEKPGKILYNGKQLACQSSSNPAVQTILQLTESNCVPPNQNITITVQTSDYRRYIYDCLQKVEQP